MKLLSVGVPVYNTAPDLKQCVESILAQTYRDIEVILVDDGSTDASGEICDEFAQQDARVHVIHQQNLGRMEARRTAVKNASGEFMTFVDSDDFIHPEMYQSLMEMQVVYDCDIVTSGIIRHRLNNEEIVTYDQLDEGFYDLNHIASIVIPNLFWKNDAYGMIPSLCNKIFRKDLLVQQYEESKDTRISYGEDILIFYPMIIGIRSMFVMHQAYYYHRKKYKENVYAGNDRFFLENYRFYERLKHVFQTSRFWDVVQKQIDLMYIASVNLRRRIYGKYSVEMKYMFPFSRVCRQSNIILYGAGVVGRSFYEQIYRTKYCNIIRWIDGQFERCKAIGLPVHPISEIAHVRYDAIVIAVAAPEIQEQIRKTLIEQYHVDAEKIIKEIS